MTIADESRPPLRHEPVATSLRRCDVTATSNAAANRSTASAGVPVNGSVAGCQYRCGLTSSGRSKATNARLAAGNRSIPSKNVATPSSVMPSTT